MFNRNEPKIRCKKLPPDITGVRLVCLSVGRHTLSRQGAWRVLPLVDALIRAQRIYTEAGGIGLFVDAIDDVAAVYYRRFVFRTSPDNPLLLLFPAKVRPAQVGQDDVGL